jgi:pyridoxamine 5'-phosphate oxidase
MKKALSFLRTEYFGEALDKSSTPESPIDLFDLWFDLAKKDLPKTANACTVATVDANGQPTARVVLLKEYSTDGFIFFTHYDSRKGLNLESNSKISMSFFWDSRFRQVLIEGEAEKISLEENQKYFSTRPRESQISAIASHQSQKIDSRKALEELNRSVEKELKSTKELDCPENWGGYLIKPKRIEFWQGRLGRLHDRIEYTRKEKHWTKERLQP